MSIVVHDELPFHEVPRIKTRLLASRAQGAQQTAVWEQRIEANGFIPLHYHDVEEVLVFLAGEVALTLDEQTSIVRAPATLIVPPGRVHGLRPAADVEIHLLAIFPCAAPKIWGTDGQLRPLPWEDFERGGAPP